MSVHTFRQRSALQRAQARWRPRANHLRLVQVTPVPPTPLVRIRTLLNRLNTGLWRIHDGQWLWVIAAFIVGAADVGFIVQFIRAWTP